MNKSGVKPAGDGETAERGTNSSESEASMAEDLTQKTLRALRATAKGKIRFDPHWAQRGEDVLPSRLEELCLSAGAGRVLERLGPTEREPEPRPPEESPAPAGSNAKVAKDMSNVALRERLQAGVDAEKDAEDAEPAVSGASGRGAGPAAPPPRHAEVERRIHRYEARARAKAQAALGRRRQMFEEASAEAAGNAAEQLRRFEALLELEQRRECQTLRDAMDKETRETMGRLEKMREEQRLRRKMLSLRLREAELERQRQAESGERARRLDEEVRRLNRLLEEEEEEKKKKRQEEEEEEESHRKPEELRAQKEAEPSPKEKAQAKGLQNGAADATLRWYEELREAAARRARSFQQLNAAKDAQTQRLKAELQKAAAIPVSQIASDSGSQLRDIFDRIDALLCGRAVASGGRFVSTSQHPQGLDFVRYKLAEKFVDMGRPGHSGASMSFLPWAPKFLETALGALIVQLYYKRTEKFVKQGEEEVASRHEAAFPIGAVLSGIWERHPSVGELFLGHLHRKCPYAVPHYPPMKDGTSVDDYRRILGYRVDDSGVEDQDSFLKRMSGMIRLYAAVIQLRWPYNSKQGSVPHGLNHGWRWLAQTLNMEPLADVTATLLFDFLEVCGNALMTLYQEQFWKLLLLLKEQYFPRITSVTSSGRMGAVSRLQAFLEVSLQRRRIAPPKGQLGATFWSS